MTELYLVFPGRGTPRDTMVVSMIHKIITGEPVSEIYLADSSDDSMKVQSYIDTHIKPTGELNWEPDSLKLLLSYHYFKKHNLHDLMAKYFGDKPPKIFVDSGAFSSMTLGSEVDLDAYIDWLKQYEDIMTHYANLDLIGDPERTYENQKIMESHGLKPMPVFHTGESIEWLQRYIDEGYTYICLGGMVPYSSDKKKLITWMSHCFNTAAESGKPIKFHGFGMTNFDLMKAYPWASVDSSSWSMSFRFGRVHLFDEKRGRFHVVPFRDVKGSYKYAHILRSYGFSPNDLAVDSNIERIKVATVSCMAFLKAEQWLNKRWKKYGKDDKLSLWITPANQMGSDAANPEVHGMIDAAVITKEQG